MGAIAVAVLAALLILAVGIFATFTLGGWWIETCQRFGRHELPAWMAGSVAILVPMILASFVFAATVFFFISGVRP